MGINPTRDGILHVCRQMNGNISILNRKMNRGADSGSAGPVFSPAGTVIEGSIIPTLIDELPMLAAMACYAKGTTVIRDAAELKVKEYNRITVMAENLRAMGADVTETEDGMIIHGGRPLHGAVIDSKRSPDRHDLRRNSPGRKARRKYSTRTVLISLIPVFIPILPGLNVNSRKAVTETESYYPILYPLRPFTS